MKKQIQRFMATGLALLLIGVGGLWQASAAEQGLESLRQTGQAFRSVAKQVSPAVVFVQVEQKGSVEEPQAFSPFDDPMGEEFFRHFFGQPPELKNPHQKQQRHHAVGQGSGFIVTSDGYIMTNNHVVDDAEKVQVKMQDGHEYTAKIIGTDPASDVAVIKIDDKNLPFLRLGNSDLLEPGDWVLAIGNPFGLSHTLTAGIVSAKGRSGIGLNDYESFIQTDAAINPGNSGGPLVNLDGEVVGINTAIFSRNGGNMGIGFAIPINMAKQVRDQLVAHGEVTRGRLGIYIQDLSRELAASFGIDKAEGILVSQVQSGSPAEKAGLRRGDVIIRIDDDAAGHVAEFRNHIAMTAPGTTVSLTVLRDGKEHVVKSTIGKIEGDKSGRPGEAGGASALGLNLQSLTPELTERFGYQGQQGVLVAAVDPGSAAANAGIERGDLLEEIDRQAVTSPDQARKILNTGKSHLLLVRHGEAARYLTLKNDE